MLRGGKLSGGGGGTESRGRMDEDDLDPARAKKRQHGLDHQVMAAHVRTVHQIEISERSLLERAMGNGAAAKHQNIYAAKIFLKALAQAADVVVSGEVRRASVTARAQRVNLPGNILAEFAATGHQAAFGAIRGY